VTHYLKGKLKVFTPTTPKDSSSILKELSQIRNRGFALSVSERQAGAASVAAPVFDVNGNPIAVISICGPAERITPTLTKYVPQLLDSASRLSKRMGYHPRKGSISG
jgi:DNA-binding IclR family transcriptional regulator